MKNTIVTLKKSTGDVKKSAKPHNEKKKKELLPNGKTLKKSIHLIKPVPKEQWYLYQEPRICSMANVQIKNLNTKTKYLKSTNVFFACQIW